jgi:hypothetical protein
MNHKQLIAIGSVLMLVILLVTACSSLGTPKNITITFDETCTMTGPTTISAGKDTTMDVIGNLKEQGDLGVVILILDPDKTIKDLQEMPSDAGQPNWSQMVGFYRFPDDGSTHSVDLNIVNGPIYFVCEYEDSGYLGVLGPIEVKE